MALRADQAALRKAILLGFTLQSSYALRRLQLQYPGRTTSARTWSDRGGSEKDAIDRSLRKRVRSTCLCACACTKGKIPRLQYAGGLLFSETQRAFERHFLRGIRGSIPGFQTDPWEHQRKDNGTYDTTGTTVGTTKWGESISPPCT